MRLDRFVSQATDLSRAEARSCIRRGRVEVGGVTVREPAAPLAGDAQVMLDGALIDIPRTAYIMLHKPGGVLCATRDARQPTVVDLLPSPLARRVHPVGRLDKHTTGLLLLTDDGAWSHRITAPRHHCPKVYCATLAEPLAEDAAARLASGLMLRGESVLTRPAVLERLGPMLVRVTVTEGRYHLVRRLFGALGNRVVTLHRERVGGLVLDPELKPGQWRMLDKTECQAVLADTALG